MAKKNSTTNPFIQNTFTTQEKFLRFEFDKDLNPFFQELYRPEDYFFAKGLVQFIEGWKKTENFNIDTAIPLFTEVAAQLLSDPRLRPAYCRVAQHLNALPGYELLFQNWLSVANTTDNDWRILKESAVGSNLEPIYGFPLLFHTLVRDAHVFGIAQNFEYVAALDKTNNYELLRSFIFKSSIQKDRVFMDGPLLVALDKTGAFSSEEIKRLYQFFQSEKAQLLPVAEQYFLDQKLPAVLGVSVKNGKGLKI